MDDLTDEPVVGYVVESKLIETVEYHHSMVRVEQRASLYQAVVW